MTRKNLSPKERERIFTAHNGTCHICHQPIQTGQRWEISHPIPLALGGEDVSSNRAPAHEHCHRTVTAVLDLPRIAKTKRQRRAHIGAKRPGLGHRPLPCGRNTRWKIKIGGGLTPRLSQGQQLARTKRMRTIGQ